MEPWHTIRILKPGAGKTNGFFRFNYLYFLPLLLYGIALAELFSQWKRFFNPGQIFLPYLLMTIILTETALYNVFIYAKLIDQLIGLNYFNYLL